MSKANPCPCELVVNDSSSNDLPNSISHLQAKQWIDDELLEEYLNLLASAAQSRTSSDQPSLAPEGETPNRPRSKRPSWAQVGKRAAALIQKRPSWAQVG